MTERIQAIRAAQLSLNVSIPSEILFGNLPESGPWPKSFQYRFSCPECRAGFCLNGKVDKEVTGSWERNKS